MYCGFSNDHFHRIRAKAIDRFQTEPVDEELFSLVGARTKLFAHGEETLCEVIVQSFAPICNSDGQTAAYALTVTGFKPKQQTRRRHRRQSQTRG